MKCVFATALLAVCVTAASADTIKVLQLKGWPSYTLYQAAANQASSFGSDAVSYSVYTGTVTQVVLDSYGADILGIADPSGDYVDYSTTERDAILAYLTEPGHHHGILGESYVFNSVGADRPHMFYMGTIFGFRSDINYTNLYPNGIFNFEPPYAGLDLFNGFTNSYTSSGFLAGNLPDGHEWTANDLNQAIVVASNADSTDIISIYDGFNYRAIYVSVWMGYQGSAADERMIYNCWHDIYHAPPVTGAGLSDLAAVQPPGWAGSVVPRRTADATETSVSAPDTLVADSLTTFFNLGIASTVPDTTSWGFSLAMDGQPLAAGSAIGKTPTGNVNLGPYRVSGGRHLMTEVLDPAALVTETNESNNRSDQQWIWYPSAIAKQSQSTHGPPPLAGALAKPDCEAFVLVRDLRYAWILAAASQSPSDAYDFACYDDYVDPRNGLSDLVKKTSLQNGMTRFIVGGFRDGRTILYPAFSDPGGSGARAGYVLCADDDRDRQTDAQHASWSGVLSRTGALAHVFEGYFEAGAHYHFVVARHDGVDRAVFEVFDPSAGLVHAVGEGVHSVIVPGTTVDSLEFVPTVSAWHSIVVYAPQWTGDSLHYDFAWSRDQNILSTPPQPTRLNALDGPFPNPLVDGSRFEVSMARAGQVDLTAYDLSGRKRGILWSGPLPAGRSTVAWGGLAKQLTPGIYWAALRAPGWETRRRFVVLGR